MSRRTLATLLSVALAGCAVGPRYAPVATPADSARIGADATSGATRAFFDSLARARANDSTAVTGPRIPPPRDLATDSIEAVAWRDIVRDTTLVRLVETALRQNRDLESAIARIREFRADVGIARAPLFPGFTANAGASTNQIAIGSAPPVSYDAFRITGDVSWELDFWGRTRRGIEAARADLAGQDAAQQAVVLTLVSDVATSYLQLLELDQERAIAERTLASRQSTLGLARQRFNQGLISELDVRQFEAQVSAPAATLAQVERARGQVEHRLSQLIGEAPRHIERGGSLVDAVTALEVPDSVPASLLARRPDVRQAERAFAAATARIGVAAAARLPAVMITGYYGTQSSSASNLFSSQGEVYQLLGGISVPIFTGGRLIKQERAARARADQARAQYQQTVLSALRDAGDALVAVRTARDEVTAQETQAQALRRATELAELRYRTGVASYVEVLEAQRGLFTAELALSQAQLGQLSASVQLYKALGGTWSK